MYGRYSWKRKRAYNRRYLDFEEESNHSRSTDSSEFEIEKPTEKSAVKNEDSEPIDETQFKGKVHALLKKISNTGGKGGNEFAIAGQLLGKVPNMLISIKDGGILKFPIYEDEVQKIIEVFEKSPYGKGTETILDPSFRNSWQLDPSAFKILNPQWESYMKEVLVPRIGEEMDIATPFTASLYKLLLYKTGSFFKVHRDSEKEERMFGTLVVQLPSEYTGGQLVVSHDSKTKTIDFSSSSYPNNVFDMFFSTFYCDCEHEILPLTSGVRTCLIYNLALTTTDLPVLVAPRMTETENQLVSLFKDWDNEGPTKIVYCLSHQYTRKNFSFENLKSSDKTIAKTLINLKQNNLAVFVGIFEKQSNGSGIPGEGSAFDSDDEDCGCERSYYLNHLKLLDAQCIEEFHLKSLSVDYEQEVIPKNCFTKNNPYSKKSRETGNTGVEVSLLYRAAALVLFPSEYIIYILMSNDEIYIAEKIFLKEFEKCATETDKDEAALLNEAKLKKWATEMTTVKGRYSYRTDLSNVVGMLSAIISFNDLKLLQEFLDRYQPIKENTISLIIGQCEKFGWTSLSSQLSNMFKTLTYANNALKMLNLIVEGEMEEDKKSVCLQLAKIVLNLAKDDYPRYSSSKNPEEKQIQVKADQDFLYAFCQTAKKIDFSVLEYAKKKSMNVVVPVLIKLSNEVENTLTLDSCWIEIAKYFLEKMEQIAAKGLIIPNWRFTTYNSCGCSDCFVVGSFMRSDRISQGFKIGKNRRTHIHQKLVPLDNIRHETENVGNPQQKLVVTKTSQPKASEAEEQKLATELIPKLKAIIPSQNL